MALCERRSLFLFLHKKMNIRSVTNEMIFSIQNIFIFLYFGTTIRAKAIEINGDQKNTRTIMLIINIDFCLFAISDKIIHSPSIVEISCWGPCARVIKEEKNFNGTGSLNKYLSMIQ